MHISQLFLSSYSPTTLIDGSLKVKADEHEVTIQLSEADRMAIQNICTQAYLADRQKIVDKLLSESPAYIALFSEVSDQSDDVPF